LPELASLVKGDFLLSGARATTPVDHTADEPMTNFAHCHYVYLGADGYGRGLDRDKRRDRL
jgi:hypothetical protein